jgi:tetratricopeptide (TPR) repeat protein
MDYSVGSRAEAGGAWSGPYGTQGIAAAGGGAKRPRETDVESAGVYASEEAGTEQGGEGGDGGASSLLAESLVSQLEQEAQEDAYDPLNPHTDVERAAAVAAEAAAVAEAAANAQAKKPRAAKDKVLQRTASGWMECYDQAKQRNYWFNKKTGESAWSRPAAATGGGGGGAPNAAAAAQRAESQFATGQRLFKQIRYEDAIEAFTTALDGGHPDKGKVFSFRGVANDFLERHEAAFNDHDAAIEPGKCACLTLHGGGSGQLPNFSVPAASPPTDGLICCHCRARALQTLAAISTAATSTCTSSGTHRRKKTSSRA